MEIENEFQSVVFDAFAQSLHIGNVLKHALPLVGIRSLRRVNKEAHTHGVEPDLLVESEHIGHFRAVFIVVDGSTLFVAVEQRDVGTRQLLVRVFVSAENDIHKCSHVAHINTAVGIHIASGAVELCCAENLVDEGSHIAHVHFAVAVDVAQRGCTALGRH